MNIGAPVNSPAGEMNAAFSSDELAIYFTSNRPGTLGPTDIWVTERACLDCPWQPPVNLAVVNTPQVEQAVVYLQSAEDGQGNLYFNRGTVLAAGDIYYAAMTRDGETRGDAVFVPELSDPAAFDQHVTLRKDGREVFIASNRAGGFGGFDIWTSTRQSTNDPWSPIQNAGPPLSTTFNDMQPSLTSDSRTMLFASTRPEGLGANDLWVSRRTPNGK